MLGVTYPLVYEYLFDQKISVGAPFYNAIFIPIVLIASLFLFFSVDSKWSRNLNFNLAMFLQLQNGMYVYYDTESYYKSILY